MKSKIFVFLMTIACIFVLASCDGKVTVTFSANGGVFENGETEIKVEIDKDSMIPEHKEPTREGYTLVGFSKNESGDPLWNFETDKFTESITLYATWHKHSFTNYVSNDDATCTADGTKTAKCDGCNETDTIIVENSKLGHDITSCEAKLSTCIDGGWEAYEICSRCDYTTYSEIKALGHEFVGYNSNNDATCTADGTKTAKCERCDVTDTKTDSGSILGHSKIQHTAKAPTCDSIGFDAYETCSRCSYSTYLEKSALGHNYTIITQNKTCAYDAAVAYLCNLCDYVYAEDIQLISLSLRYTGSSSATFNGYGNFEKYYEVDVKGGYGDILLKYELYSSSTAIEPLDILDFTISNSYQISYRGYENDIDNYVLKITAQDTLNNIIVSTVTLDNLEVVEQYVQVDHNYSDVDDKCTLCGKLIDYTVGLRFELINNGTEYTVSSIGSATDADIIVPRTYEGKPVTAIGKSAFEQCQTIRSIRLHKGIKTIDKDAFDSSSLTIIDIPNSVESIGWGAFSKCKITEITIPESVTEIGEFAFSNCWYMTNFTCLSDANILEHWIFYGCRDLTTVRINNQIKTIEENAFYSCESLNEIIFDGTKAEWAEITKKSGWDVGTGNYIIHCTDGDLTKAEA